MKAYTLANLGPIRDTNTSSGIADSILSSGNANPQLSNIPGMLLVGGAVMIVKDGKRAGVLGVAGRSSRRSLRMERRQRDSVGGFKRVTATRARGTSRRCGSS